VAKRPQFQHKTARLKQVRGSDAGAGGERGNLPDLRLLDLRLLDLRLLDLRLLDLRLLDLRLADLRLADKRAQVAGNRR
jgi:hypothetical protein